MDLEAISPGNAVEIVEDRASEKALVGLISIHVKQERMRGIDFTLSILKQLQKKVDQHLLNPRDLQFTLKTSLRDLIAALEVQKFDVQ